MATQHLSRENLSREVQVMLAGLQAHLTTAPKPDWTALLTPALDWTQILRLCQFHEVTPLVYESLNKHPDKVPAETLAQLKQQVIKDKKHSLHLAQVLQSLVAVFEQETIELLPYKGVALSQQLFGDIAKRPTKDLDIAVQKKDYVRARDLLHAQGFVGPFTGLGQVATPQQERLILESSHHHVFRGRGCEIELHFEIMPPSGHRAFSLQDVWQHLEDKKFASYPVKEMPSELLLFVLSTHAAIHYWKRLKWLFDSAWLLDQLALSESLLSKAKTTQRETLLLANAKLCHELLGLPLPEQVTASLATRPSLHKLCSAIMQQYQTWPHHRIHGLEEFKYRVWLSDNVELGSLQKLLSHKLVKGGYHFFSAPKFVYAFLNPLRLTARFVSQFFRG